LSLCAAHYRTSIRSLSGAPRLAVSRVRVQRCALHSVT
jgi:hypothetical protein